MTASPLVNAIGPVFFENDLGGSPVLEPGYIEAFRTGSSRPIDLRAKAAWCCRSRGRDWAGFRKPVVSD